MALKNRTIPFIKKREEKKRKKGKMNWKNE